MRHRRFGIDEVSISDRPLSTRRGDLVVAERDGATHLDWELVSMSTEPTDIERSPYRLVMSGPEGRFSGSAVLVRSDGLTHVFRGAGELEGFETDQFN